jgi:hypothetical protein
MMRISSLSAQTFHADAVAPGSIKPSKATACKDASVTSTLSIISEKTGTVPELQTGKCGFAAQSAALLQSRHGCGLFAALTSQRRESCRDL